jgi:outer membrane biosynthesis protein TonB
MPRGKHWTNKEKARVSAMLAINLKPKDMAMHVDRTPHAITLYVTKHPEIRNTAAMLELLDAEIKKEMAGPEATPVQEKTPQAPAPKPRRKMVAKPTVVRKNIFGRIWDAIRG